MGTPYRNGSWSRRQQIRTHASERNAVCIDECCVSICSLFIPHAKTTELIQPCEGTFHNPALVLSHYHAVCGALQAEAGCAGHVSGDGCLRRRKPGHPAQSW